MTAFALLSALLVADDYDFMHGAAVQLNRPLVVAVACESPKGPWLTCRVSAPWHWRKVPGLIVSRPDGKVGLEYVGELPATATANDVRRLLFPAVENKRVSAPMRSANC